MASDKRPTLNLACEDCKRRNYVTVKNRSNTQDRLELKKFCKRQRKHTVHKLKRK